MVRNELIRISLTLRLRLKSPVPHISVTLLPPKAIDDLAVTPREVAPAQLRITSDHLGSPISLNGRAALILSSNGNDFGVHFWCLGSDLVGRNPNHLILATAGDGIRALA